LALEPQNPKKGRLALNKPFIQPRSTIFGFLRATRQYFVDPVSMRPVIFVENHGRKRALSGERWLTGP
jgi:hypothetical protein